MLTFASVCTPARWFHPLAGWDCCNCYNRPLVQSTVVADSTCRQIAGCNTAVLAVVAVFVVVCVAVVAAAAGRCSC